MKVTMLGCGTSVGVPALGRAGWGSCDPKDSRNRRQRCAVLVEVNDTTILVDAGNAMRCLSRRYALFQFGCDAGQTGVGFRVLYQFFGYFDFQ